MANAKVFFEITIGGKPAGRIEFEVYIFNGDDYNIDSDILISFTRKMYQRQQRTSALFALVSGYLIDLIYLLQSIKLILLGEKGKGLAYEGSFFHRIIPNFMCQVII